MGPFTSSPSCTSKVSKVLKRMRSCAFDMFLIAADLGWPFSQYKVSDMYERGIGVLKDSMQARYWRTQADLKCGGSDEDKGAGAGAGAGGDILQGLNLLAEQQQQRELQLARELQLGKAPDTPRPQRPRKKPWATSSTGSGRGRRRRYSEW